MSKTISILSLTVIVPSVSVVGSVIVLPLTSAFKKNALGILISPEFSSAKAVGSIV